MLPAKLRPAPSGASSRSPVLQTTRSCGAGRGGGTSRKSVGGVGTPYICMLVFEVKSKDAARPCALGDFSLVVHTSVIEVDRGYQRQSRSACRCPILGPHCAGLWLYSDPVIAFCQLRAGRESQLQAAEKIVLTCICIGVRENRGYPWEGIVPVALHACARVRMTQSQA